MEVCSGFVEVCSGQWRCAVQCSGGGVQCSPADSKGVKLIAANSGGVQWTVAVFPGGSD